MSSPIVPAGRNWQREAQNLKSSGYPVSRNPVMARLEAKKVNESVGRGSLTDIANRQRTSEMNRRRLQSSRGVTGSLTRQASDLQMALPKMRTPGGSMLDKGIPMNVNDPKELIELRRWCNTPDAPVWMADYTFKPIGEIEVGDQVIGWDTREHIWGSGRRELTKTTVLAVNRRKAPEVVRVTFASGRTVKCTPDHEWLRYYVPGPDGRILNGPEKSLSKRHDSEYAPLSVGSVARAVIEPTVPLADPEKIAAAHWLAGIFDGEGSWSKSSLRICQSQKHNPAIVARIDESLELLGMSYRRRVVERHDAARGTGVHGGQMVIWDLGRGGNVNGKAKKNRQQVVDFYNWARPVKFDQERMDTALLTRNFGDADEVVSIESLGPGEVVSMQTTTGNYTAWGLASKNCRLFYSTHDLVPLLVDIYSKFPVTGLEFQSKDPLIEKFYTEMFLDDLNYEEFLPDAVLREYFVAGEVTTLAHFNESLGIWSAEEVLNPDMIAVSKSLFVEEERVQLLVKELVETLRNGPGGKLDNDERPSERLERNWEYQQLIRQYPEIIQAAARDDGLDMSDALVSRMVNKANPWDLRGTPFLLRSFRTLLMEEELNAAQDAVAGRLYAPMILATMGIENMGNDEPWIPGQGELDDLRDDMQNALAADFKLLVHNFGVKVESVFGRESVPDFGNDYDRIDAKLMQAWGIGQALIMGGTGAGGAYASSALNREVCEQLMMGAQRKVVRHIKKRMAVIAEAQEHYDYELKGGQRVPLYREVVEEDEYGEQRIVRVPKLLMPDVHFATLNLRDEQTERQFIMDLKTAGVPISDKKLAVNIKVDFEQELEREQQETVDKAMAKAQAWKEVQDRCDAEDKPYPEELVQHLSATLNLRQLLAGVKMAEDQTKMMDQQAAVASPAGQLGAAPGTSPMPGAPGADAMGGAPPDGDPGGAGPPQGGPPEGSGPSPAEGAPGGGAPAGDGQRPAESDDMRGSQPRSASRKVVPITSATSYAQRVHGPHRNYQTPFEKGPSTVGRHLKAGPADVYGAVNRQERARHHGAPLVSHLVKDPNFYRMCHATGDMGQIKADWAEIRAGGAQESRRLLADLVDQYEEITGDQPIWD